MSFQVTVSVRFSDVPSGETREAHFFVNNYVWNAFLMLCNYKTTKKGTRWGMQFSCLEIGGVRDPKDSSYDLAAAD